MPRQLLDDRAGGVFFPLPPNRAEVHRFGGHESTERLLQRHRHDLAWGLLGLGLRRFDDFAGDDLEPPGTDRHDSDLSPWADAGRFANLPWDRETSVWIECHRGRSVGAHCLTFAVSWAAHQGH